MVSIPSLCIRGCPTTLYAVPVYGMRRTSMWGIEHQGRNSTPLLDVLDVPLPRRASDPRSLNPWIRGSRGICTLEVYT